VLDIAELLLEVVQHIEEMEIGWNADFEATKSVSRNRLTGRNRRVWESSCMKNAGK
jgi:hypothetical protein